VSGKFNRYGSMAAPGGFLLRMTTGALWERHRYGNLNNESVMRIAECKPDVRLLFPQILQDAWEMIIDPLMEKGKQ
jgi:hypothetical protein